MRKQLRHADKSESDAFDQEMASIEEAEQLEREMAARAPVVEAHIASDSPVHVS
jgi:transcription elongation GreA/GreB family factor